MELDEREKRFLALAIQHLVVRQGLAIIPIALAVGQKLDLLYYVQEYFRSWVKDPEYLNLAVIEGVGDEGP